MRKLSVILAVLLCMAMLAGCQKTNNVKTDADGAQVEATGTTGNGDGEKNEGNDTSPLAQAQAAIDAGELRKAYDLLKADDSEEAAEMLENFAFVPTKIVYNEQDTEPYTFTSAYTYDTYGNILAYDYSAEDGTWVKVTRTYDKLGNILTANYSDSDEEWAKVVRSFDANGNLLTEVTTDSGENREEYVYTYYEDGTKKSYSSEIRGTVAFDIDSITTAQIEISDTDGRWEKTARTYDENGNWLTEETSNSDGEWEKSSYTYDAKGNQLTWNTSNSDGLNEENTCTYTFDAKGNITVEEWHCNDGSWWKSTYTYNEDGSGKTEESIDSDGGFGTRTYTYDEEGNEVMLTSDQYYADMGLTEKVVSNADGFPLLSEMSDDEGWWDKRTYTYDENGNKLTETTSDSDGEWREQIYTYDENGNVLTEETFYDGGYWTKDVYTYDEQGNAVTRDYSTEHGTSVKVTCTYDENGNMVTEHATSSKGLERHATYTYDSDGNPLTKNRSSKNETEKVSTAWQLCYYPNGIPEVVSSAIDRAESLVSPSFLDALWL